MATAHATSIIEQLTAALKAHDTQREERRKNIWDTYGGLDDFESAEPVPETPSPSISPAAAPKAPPLPTSLTALGQQTGLALREGEAVEGLRARLKKRRKKLLRKQQQIVKEQPDEEIHHGVEEEEEVPFVVDITEEEEEEEKSPAIRRRIEPKETPAMGKETPAVRQETSALGQESWDELSAQPTVVLEEEEEDFSAAVVVKKGKKRSKVRL